MVLNLRCNAKATQKRGYPNNRTCCNSYRPFSWIHYLAMLLAFIFGLISLKTTWGSRRRSNLCLWRQGWPATYNGPTTSAPIAVLVVLISAFYCVVTDRSQTFYKLPQHFSSFDFRLLIAVALIPCLLTIKRSIRRSYQRFCDSRHWLSKIQVDEFKGWLQIFILAYRYTGASKKWGFYKVNQLALGFYLFLSGYGHSMHLLQGNDFTLRRVATVLLRLNIFPTVLACIMNRPYSSYYFAPLASFWFLIVFVTLQAFHHSNWSWKSLAIVLSATRFFYTKRMFELITFPLRFICGMEIDVDEWMSRIGSDGSSVYAGMITAMIILKKIPPIQARAHHFDSLWMQALLAALFIIPGFWVLTHILKDNSDDNRWLPYMSWLPIIFIVTIRNATKCLRSHHCAAFVRIGSISLELYLLSEHIWLAGDGHGLLRVTSYTGDGSLWKNRWLDLMFLTPILLFVACHVKAATKTATAWIVGHEDQTVGNRVAANGSSRNAGVQVLVPSGPMVQRNTMPRVYRRWRLEMPKDLRWRLVMVGVGVWLCNWLR